MPLKDPNSRLEQGDSSARPIVACMMQSIRWGYLADRIVDSNESGRCQHGCARTLGGGGGGVQDQTPAVAVKGG